MNFKSDRDVVKTAVAQDGDALKYADAILRRDRDVAKSAVAQLRERLSVRPFQFADETLRQGRNFLLAAAIKRQAAQRLASPARQRLD